MGIDRNHLSQGHRPTDRDPDGDRELAEALQARGINDRAVLEAMASLHRDRFVPSRLSAFSTEDRPLPIGHGQTISQPYVVAYMTATLSPRPGERILEIGTGSGYQAAVLARMGAEVFSVEIVPELARSAAETLEAQGIERVHVRQGDGRLGWPEEAPFDAVLVTAAAEELQDSWTDQLRPGGRLLAPVGPHEAVQALKLLRKGRDGADSVEDLLSVRFVPLTGGDPRTFPG